jgi:hypothetical protein
MHKFKKEDLFYLLLIFLFFLAFINLIYLDLKENVVFPNTQTTKVIYSPQPTTGVNDQNVCPKSCLTQIYQATSSSKPTAVPLVNASSGQTQTAKEFYVALGSGSGFSSNWQDVSGLAAYIDSASYPKIKTVVFEISIHIPTGNETANVRLYNATDNHPVWNSDINFQGSSTSQSLSSQPISLDSGNKLYKVQMQTQLEYPAVLDQSRIHIITY